MRLTLFAAICLSLISLPLTAQTVPTFRFDGKHGPQTVGLKIVEQYDYSRAYQPMIDDLGKPFQGERARPLQTLVWYPAQKSGKKPMTVRDYTALQATETSFATPKESTGIEAWFAAGMNTSADSTMWAVRDAPLASGHFPVVIYAPSFTSVSWENADLCEYLASYGYVVLASPGMGVGHESTHDVAGVNAQARDISFLIGYAHDLPDTDMSEVGVVGFSWGGLSNLAASAQDNRIDALVGLDGSLRYFPGVVKQAGISPEQMTIPMLFFKGATSLEGQAQLDDRFKSQGQNVLNAWTHGDLISVEMLGLIHPEFSSMAQRNEKFWKYEFAGLEQADYGREDGALGYGWVARYTQEFLDAYLKHDAQALKYLHESPAENSVPKHTMAVNYRPAQKLPASLDSFRVEVGSKGFDHSAEIYAATQMQQSDFRLDAGAVTSWAYDLLADDHLAEAIGIMKLAARLDPSSRAYSSLGEMYTKAGDNKAAIESYTEALAKDSGNILAKQGLEEFGSNGPTRK